MYYQNKTEDLKFNKFNFMNIYIIIVFPTGK